MTCITSHGVAGCKTPAIFTIALIIMGVFYTMPIMDQRMVPVQLPVVCILVLQAIRIKAKIGIMGPEKRSNRGIVMLIVIQFGFQLIRSGILRYGPVTGPTLFVHFPGYGIGRGSRCQYVHDQAFVITSHREVHFPFVIGRPMPIEHILPALGIPVPLYTFP
jgi:hypothetical protein